MSINENLQKLGFINDVESLWEFTNPVTHMMVLVMFDPDGRIRLSLHDDIDDMVAPVIVTFNRWVAETHDLLSKWVSVYPNEESENEPSLRISES